MGGVDTALKLLKAASAGFRLGSFLQEAGARGLQELQHHLHPAHGDRLGPCPGERHPRLHPDLLVQVHQGGLDLPDPGDAAPLKACGSFTTQPLQRRPRLISWAVDAAGNVIVAIVLRDNPPPGGEQRNSPATLRCCALIAWIYRAPRWGRVWWVVSRARDLAADDVGGIRVRCARALRHRPDRDTRTSRRAGRPLRLGAVEPTQGHFDFAVRTLVPPIWATRAYCGLLLPTPRRCGRARWRIYLPGLGGPLRRPRACWTNYYHQRFSATPLPWSEVWNEPNSPPTLRRQVPLSGDQEQDQARIIAAGTSPLGRSFRTSTRLPGSRRTCRCRRAASVPVNSQTRSRRRSSGFGNVMTKRQAMPRRHCGSTGSAPDGHRINKGCKRRMSRRLQVMCLTHRAWSIEHLFWLRRGSPRLPRDVQLTSAGLLLRPAARSGR